MKEEDKVKFLVLKCGSKDGFGYMPSSPYKEMALKLMKEGFLENNLESNWHVSGWENTRKGERTYKRILREIRKEHGHIWKKSDYGRGIDSFGYSSGDCHNGPICIKCGYGYCHHCQNEWEIIKCSSTLKEKQRLIKKKEEELDKIKRSRFV